MERLRPRYSVIGVAIFFSFIFAGTGLAVRRGTELGGTGNVYFGPANGAIPYASSSASPAGPAGTASVAKYKRCLITAGHVLESGVDRVYMGADLRAGVVNNNTKRQLIANSSYVQGYQTGLMPNDVRRAWNDIAVLWLEMKASVPNGEQRIQAADYSPLQVGSADDYGLTPITMTQAIDQVSPGAPIDSYIAGYGRTIAFIDPPGVWSSVDGGVLLWGFPRAMQYMYGSSDVISRPGSVIQTIRDTDSGRIGCSGDSGSPLRLKGEYNTLFGVLSMAFGTGGYVGGTSRYSGVQNPVSAGCVDMWTNTYTTFDDSNTTGGTTNFKRVNEAIAKTCKKSLSMENYGHGSIAGSFTPEWTDPNGAQPYNGSINCSWDDPYSDCYEAMHEGDAITVTATAATNWEFKKWDETSSACPCLPDSNPCTIGYGDMGEYTEDKSSDDTHCIAVFEEQMGGGGSSSSE